MKLKFAAAVLVILASSGCVTSTNSYTRDIVYRDGSYYSPADEQNGDYYYEPEPDYSYYDNYNYGFGYYNSPWYGGYSSYSCRFSYHYDRYCDRGWGNAFLNFGGLTIFFGSPDYYGYGYPYFGRHSRHRTHDDGPIPMPKPGRPIHQIPDYGFNNGSGMQVPGEPVLMPTKPGRMDQNPVEPTVGQQNLNPYTRTRHPRPDVRPENGRSDREDNDGNGVVVLDDNNQPIEKPGRPNPRLQPYPRSVNSGPGRQHAPAADGSDTGAAERVGRMPRQERSSPRVEQPRQRVERSERSERPVREIRKESSDG